MFFTHTVFHVSHCQLLRKGNIGVVSNSLRYHELQCHKVYTLENCSDE